MTIPLGIRWIILPGAVLLLGGFVLGEKAYRNPLVHTLVEVVDIKDASCRKASVSVGSSCPVGCRAKPLSGPEQTRRAPECRSVLWVATCGAECDAREGLLRSEDGAFVESAAFIVVLQDPPEGFKEEFVLMGIGLTPMASGLWRYRATYDNPEGSMRAVERMERRMRDLPYAASVERIMK